MEKKRIKNILVINDFGSINGGASKVAFSEMFALKQKGYNVIYICGVGPVSPSIEQNGIEVFCLNQKDILFGSKIVSFCRGLWNTRARRVIYGILSKYDSRDTIIHIHGWSKCLSPSILNVGDKLGFKTFITLHDFFLYCPNGGLLNYKKSCICSLNPMSYKCLLCNCDSRSVFHKYWRCFRQFIQDYVIGKCSNLRFISISKLSDELFLKYRPYWYQKICRIDNPIEFKSPIIESNNTNNIGSKYLFIGRLSEEKGIRLFLNAILQTGVGAEVWGDGYLMDELKAKYPNVCFRGWVNDSRKKNYINDIKALVFPSIWYETFGLVVAEMLSLGIPCIVGDKTAASELIQDGKNGYLYKLGDLSSLKEAILKMEKNRVLLNPETCFEKSKYSVQNHIEKLVAFYTDSI